MPKSRDTKRAAAPIGGSRRAAMHAEHGAPVQPPAKSTTSKKPTSPARKR